MIKCDEPMREKKERAAKKRKSIEQWKCTGECVRCICGLRKKDDGTYEHI